MIKIIRPIAKKNLFKVVKELRKMVVMEMVFLEKLFKRINLAKKWAIKESKAHIKRLFLKIQILKSAEWSKLLEETIVASVDSYFLRLSTLNRSQKEKNLQDPRILRQLRILKT